MKKVLFAFSFVLLTGCGKDPIPLPTEPVTATGTVLSVELSRLRKGTHKLLVNGVDTYYLESSALNLRDFEGQDVGVYGKLSRNLDLEDLLVMRVERVSANLPESTVLSLPAFRMTMTVPEDWSHASVNGAEILSIAGSGSTPLLRILKATQTTLPEGVSLLLGGRKAVRTLNADNSETYYIESPTGIVSLTAFIPSSVGTDAKLFTQITTVMRSIRFAGSASSSAISTGSAGSAAASEAVRTPCGGPAGILCPQNSVCIITDAQSNIGFCQEIRR